jgi:bifunctional NMN adenylyltransferase/nudix hydrolase
MDVKWPDGKEFDVGVVVGRFQVPSFHEGHKYLLDSVVDNHKYMMVIIGVSPSIGTTNDPMDYLTRMEMIRGMYPQAVVVPITDVNNDLIWSRNLDLLIRGIFPSCSIRLYGGRDSFLDVYCGDFDTFQISNVTDTSGTFLRRQITVPINSDDFRKGVIYGINSKPWGIVVCTVDIAIINQHDEVLLGIKHNDKGKLRFPGGFVSYKDVDYECAARRELLEETSLVCNDLKYLGSFKVNDWRYSGANEALFTSFYLAHFFSGLPKAGDDLDEIKWCKIKFLKSDEVVEYHKPLLSKLKQAII